jgi:hypothetical protein
VIPASADVETGENAVVMVHAPRSLAADHRETSMSSHYHAVVWIDHHEARVFHFNVLEMNRLVPHPEHPTRHIHHKANSIGSGHAVEDQDFFQHVADAVADAGAVLVTGPANAKTELVKHIQHHAGALSARIVGVATLDHPTDNEILAMARSYFKADHQMPPRI